MKEVRIRMENILFIVSGEDWSLDVEVEADSFDTYAEIAFEAMSRAVDQICNEPGVGEYCFGPVMIAYEKGYENDLDKRIVILTEYVLRNSGHHDVAEGFNRKTGIDLKKEIEQIDGYRNPFE